ncbi:MAG: hypothetical protein P8Q97_03380 [Myxococcota bacterium]|jgi:hypothetical protein|nr:hypothetical protein [Myxococcota bacterium]
MKNTTKNFLVFLILFTALTFATSGCCSHGSWGSKHGWKCHG